MPKNTNAFLSHTEIPLSGNNFFQQTQKRYVTQDSHRGPSLYQQFKNIFKEQIKKDEELQKNLKEFQENKGGQKIQETGSRVKETYTKIGDRSKPAFEKAKSGLDRTSDRILESAERFSESKAVKKAEASVEKVRDQKYVKMVVDEWTKEDRMRRQLHYIFRSEYGRKLDAERGVFWNPYTKKMEQFTEEDYDTETMDVTVVNEEGPSVNRFSNIIKRLDDQLQKSEGKNSLIHTGAGAAKKIFERVGQSRIARLPEDAEVMNLLKERDSSFDLDIFLGNLEHIIIPQVVKSFLTDDIETLKKLVTPNCFQRYLYPHIKSRIHAKQKFDTKILNISDIDLYTAKKIGGHPTLLITANISYIHCIRDIDGKIVEGGKNEVRQVHGSFALRQDPSENSLDWEIVESAFGMPEKLL